MMFLFWLVVIGVVAWLLATLVRRESGDGPRARSEDRGDRAESVLRERYARGEIDEGTYKRMLDELRRP